MNRHQIMAFHRRKDNHMHVVPTILHTCVLLLCSVFPLSPTALIQMKKNTTDVRTLLFVILVPFDHQAHLSTTRLKLMTDSQIKSPL